MNVLERLRASFAAATPEGGDPLAFASAVRVGTDPKFGDYQANGCMALAKLAKKNPRELAQAVANSVDLAPLADHPEVAGPGFLNVRLKDAWIASTLGDLLVDDRLGIEPAATPLSVVIDYSSPNVAKPMHVGHIRSTVIGESLARIFSSLGHSVVRDNHLGDWGSQFGMILWGWKNHRDEANFAENPVAELARLYKLARTRIDGDKDKDVERATRQETVKLHAGDPENRGLWDRFMPFCLAALRAVYDRLGVRFDVELGESFYDPMLADVVKDLEAKGLAVESEGATVVFTEATKAPMLVRKSDGAFNYATSDLATIRYREETWRPDLVLYVVDHRQGDHFKALFDVAKRWGYERVRLEHVAFGTVLGHDRRPFKTREGDVIGLESLLDEAIIKARQVVDANSPELDDQERSHVSEIVGLGAIKYADLSQNRTSDYVFDYDKMMALNGNTATYIQYAYARCHGVIRKAETTPEAIRALRPPIFLDHPAERALGVQILRLPETLEMAASELKPNILADFLFDLANRYSTFYDGCPRPQGRVRRASQQPPRPLRPHGEDAEIRPEFAGDRRGRADVTKAGRPRGDGPRRRSGRLGPFSASSSTTGPGRSRCRGRRRGRSPSGSGSAARGTAGVIMASAWPMMISPFANPPVTGELLKWMSIALTLTPSAWPTGPSGVSSLSTMVMPRRPSAVPRAPPTVVLAAILPVAVKLRIPLPIDRFVMSTEGVIV